MRFLVIEGLDGSGKSTQVELLSRFLEKSSIRFRYLHFPRLEEGVYGKLIARFLRGEMGEIDQVDPYLVALIFAGDRKDAVPLLKQWIDEDFLVIVDRYVYSNIAFQCAKLNDRNEQQLLADWIINLEYDLHQLPVPDLNIFLDVPFEFTRERLSFQREGEDRTYLRGRNDIHEQDIIFQEKVRRIYHTICLEQGNLAIVDCADSGGKISSPEEIFEKIKYVIGL